MYGETGLRITRSNLRYSVCHCPLPGHNDKHASAVIYHDNNVFICFRCHVTLPLNELLKSLGLEGYDFYTPKDFNPNLFDDGVKVMPLTTEALDYLEFRNIDVSFLPKWVASPLKNNGVSFIFQNNGKIFGYQTRLFPYFVEEGGARYVFEGRRLPWFGDLDVAKRHGWHIVVFEKAFGALKAHIAAVKYGLPVVPLCSAGSNIRFEILDLVGPATPFVFDNDEAGKRAAAFVKKRGFKAFIPKFPIDESEVGNIAKILEKIVES